MTFTGPGWRRCLPDDGSAGYSTVDAIPAEFSDENLALRFTAEHRDRLRYVAGWGRWMEWDGAVWRADTTRHVFDLSRRICRQASCEADKESVAAVPENLKAEWPGILQWAIEGCLDWQDMGLAPPQAVLDATEEYLEAEDALGAWIGESCIRSKSLEEESSRLYGSWKAWAEQAGEAITSQKRFSQAMQSRGFAPARASSGKATLQGLGLKANAPSGRDRAAGETHDYQ